MGKFKPVVPGEYDFEYTELSTITVFFSFFLRIMNPMQDRKLIVA